MKKIILFASMAFAALALQVQNASAQTVGPFSYKMREIQYDLQGNSMQAKLSDFPAPGIKCIRLLDGDRKTTTGPSCAILGPSFFVDSDYVIHGTTNFNDLTNKPATLAGYGISDGVSQSALSSQLSGYATTGALSNYATTASLSSYVTNSSLTGTLASYVTGSQLTTGLGQKFDKPTGTTAQYLRGDGSLALLDAYPSSTNPAGYLTGINSAQVTSALGLTPVSQAGARQAISLTTTGTGAATYNSATGVLNVPTPTIPAAPPTINRVVATTATDGTYTWTLPTACAAGTVPVVSVTPESTAANEIINHKLTGKTNATVSISLTRALISLNAVLGLNIPILQTTPGAIPVHLIAICQ